MNQVLQFLDEAPVTVLLGARQTGKTTLAQMVADVFENKNKAVVHRFDLERAASRASLATPEITLESLPGLVVIDEIQLGQVLALLGSNNAYFWSTQRGAELDLLLLRDGMRWGFEFRCSDAPSMTKSMHRARPKITFSCVDPYRMAALLVG